MQEAEITIIETGEKEWVDPVLSVTEDATHFHIDNGFYTYSYEKDKATYVIRDRDPIEE